MSNKLLISLTCMLLLSSCAKPLSSSSIDSKDESSSVSSSVSSSSVHEHEYTQKEKVDPTEDSDGYILYSCTCGEEKREVIPALSEENGYEITKVFPTIEKDGYFEYTHPTYGTYRIEKSLYSTFSTFQTHIEEKLADENKPFNQGGFGSHYETADPEEYTFSKNQSENKYTYGNYSNLTLQFSSVKFISDKNVFEFSFDYKGEAITYYYRLYTDNSAAFYNSNNGNVIQGFDETGKTILTSLKAGTYTSKTEFTNTEDQYVLNDEVSIIINDDLKTGKVNDKYMMTSTMSFAITINYVSDSTISLWFQESGVTDYKTMINLYLDYRKYSYAALNYESETLDRIRELGTITLLEDKTSKKSLLFRLQDKNAVVTYISGEETQEKLLPLSYVKTQSSITIGETTIRNDYLLLGMEVNGEVKSVINLSFSTPENGTMAFVPKDNFYDVQYFGFYQALELKYSDYVYSIDDKNNFTMVEKDKYHYKGTYVINYFGIKDGNFYVRYNFTFTDDVYPCYVVNDGSVSTLYDYTGPIYFYYFTTGEVKRLGGYTKKHVHKYAQQIVSSETLRNAATKTEAATYYYTCSCGEISTTEFFSYGDPLE